MRVRLTAVFKKVPEGYIAFIEEIPGVNTQGATLADARRNLFEAMELVLEANRALAREREPKATTSSGNECRSKSEAG